MVFGWRRAMVKTAAPAPYKEAEVGKPAVQITFRNIKPSLAIENLIRAEADKLSVFYPRVMGCRVAVEVPHRHHKKGAAYHLRIEVIVPGGDIVVKREPNLSAHARQLGQDQIRKTTELKVPHKDLFTAINDAFQAVGRRLQDYARRQRGDVKMHYPLDVGEVIKILPREGYGFLTSSDGREIYFHKNSVLKGQFSRLKEGTVVSFVEEAGEKGPQASTVRIVTKEKGARADARAAVTAD